jgi:hypothetical protein
MCPWTLTENVPAKSAAIGALLGCPVRTSAALVECLNARPALQIVNAVKIFMVGTYNRKRKVRTSKMYRFPDNDMLAVVHFV